MRWPWRHRRTPRIVIPVPAEIGDGTRVWLSLRGTVRTDGHSTYVTADEVGAYAMTGGSWSEQFTDGSMPVLEVRGLVVRGKRLPQRGRSWQGIMVA